MLLPTTQEITLPVLTHPIKKKKRKGKNENGHNLVYVQLIIIICLYNI